ASNTNPHRGRAAQRLPISYRHVPILLGTWAHGAARSAAGPGWRLCDHLRLRGDLHYLEPERIPAAYFRIVRRRRVGVLDGRDPVGESLLAAGALPLGFQVAHLREIRDTARPTEEAQRLHLRACRAAVLVDVERRYRVGGIPQGIPLLVALGR